MVEAGSGGAIREVSHVKVDERYPLCIVDSVSGADIDVNVTFVAREGTLDQAAGLAIRIQDEKNYYVGRANALEGNVRLYHVINGDTRVLNRAEFRQDSMAFSRSEIWIVAKLENVSEIA